MYFSLLYKEIPWRLEERIVIEPPFSPAEIVSLSFCLSPSPCKGEKISSLGRKCSNRPMAPREMGKFSERKASWCEVAGKGGLLVWEPLAVSEFSGCQKPNSWSEGSPRQGAGCSGVPGFETVSLMGRNLPMNDFCALGLSAPISISELVGL